MTAAERVWASYCARHGVADADRDFGADLIRRGAEQTRERAALLADAVVSGCKDMAPTSQYGFETLARHIRAMEV